MFYNTLSKFLEAVKGCSKKNLSIILILNGKEDNVILKVRRGYAYLRGVCLLFLPKLRGGTFIWGATLIRNSRVHTKLHHNFKLK